MGVKGVPEDRVTLHITLMMSQVPCPLGTLRKMWHVYTEDNMLSVSSEHVMFDDNMPLLLGLV
jgi:hypothetical protein